MVQCGQFLVNKLSLPNNHPILTSGYGSMILTKSTFGRYKAEAYTHEKVKMDDLNDSKWSSHAKVDGGQK